MSLRGLTLLTFIALMLTPLSGWAQPLLNAKSKESLTSTLFPLIPLDTMMGGADSVIPKSIATSIYERCKSKLPFHFTPESHEYYCTCAAAATQGTMTQGELRALQKKETRVTGNKTFEKYVVNVMKACAEEPVASYEYSSCISNRKTDWRIRFPVRFCRCSSMEMQQFFKETGEASMLLTWANKKLQNDDPVQAIWKNEKFLKMRSNARKNCTGNYLDPLYGD